MSRNAVRTLEDWAASTLSATVHPNRDGDLELLADQLLENQYLHERNTDGTVKGGEYGGFVRAAGRYVYVSETNGSQSTMTRHTSSPLDIEEPAWELADAPIKGQLPLRNSTDPAASVLPRPDPVVLSTRSDGMAGFAGGVRLYTYTIQFWGIGHYISFETAPAEPVEFEMLDGQGIEIKLPDVSSIPRGGSVHHYISEAVPVGQTPSRKTLRWQRRTGEFTKGRGARGRDTIKLNGPYKKATRQPPEVNQTYIGKPPAYTEAQIKLGHADFTLQNVDVRFAYSYLTRLGESLPSRLSRGYTFRKDGVGKQPNRALYVPPPRRRRGTYGWNLYAIVNDTWYAIHNRNGEHRHYSFDEPPVPFYGYGAADLQEKNIPRRIVHVLTSQSPPEEDNSGIPDPSTQPDVPVGFGRPSLPAGKYWVGDEMVDEEGKRSVMSRPQRVTVGTGEIIRVRFARRGNQLRNPEFSQVDRTGKPLNWTIDTTNGSYTTRGGELTISTTGSVIGGPMATSDAIDVNTTQNYCITGEFLATIFAGGARCHVQELNSVGTVVATTTLADINGTGLVSFEQVLGPGGTPLNGATAQIRIVGRAKASQTNELTATMRHLGIFPNMLEAPRKVDYNADGEATFDVSPATPYPEEPYAAVAPPPTVPTPPESEPTYLARTDFENGVLTQSDFTLHVGSPSPTHEVRTFNTIEGAYSFNVRSDANTGQTTAYYNRVFTAAELDASGAVNSLAIRGKFQVNRLPSGTNENVRLGHIQSLTGSRMARLLLRADGALIFFPTDSNSQDITDMINYPLNVAVGDVVEWEIIATQGLSTNGEVRLLIGLNGAQRTERTSKTDINWSDRRPGRVGTGIIAKSNPNSGLNIDFDSIRVTPSGAPLSAEPPPPVGVAYPNPDRPQNLYTAWAASTAYSVGNERVPTTANGHYYRVTVAGTSGTTQPAWPLGSGVTVRDNAGMTAVARSTVYAVGAAVLKPGGTSTDAEWYEATMITGTGTTAATAPAYPTTAGTTVLDGEVTFTCRKTVTWREAGSVYIEKDPDSEPIHQLYIFIPPDYKRQGFFRSTPVGVIPGATYSGGIYSRHTMFSGASSTVQLMAKNEDTEEKIGNIAVESGKVGWADRQLLSKAIPLGFTEAYLQKPNILQGIYVYQMPALSKGATVKRGYGRAASGTATVVLPGRTLTHPGLSAYELGWGAPPEVAWDNPNDATVNVTASWRTAETLGSWSASTTNPATLKPSTYLEIKPTLSGDGRYGPRISSGGVGMPVRSGLPTFVRSNRSALPGGTLLGGQGFFTSVARPDYDIKRVAGRRRATPLTDDIARLPAFSVLVFTELAAEEIAELCLEEEWGVEIGPPFAPAPGLFYRIKLPDVVDLNPEGILPIHNQTVYGWGHFEIPEGSEVLEAAPLENNLRRY